MSDEPEVTLPALFPEDEEPTQDPAYATLSATDPRTWEKPDDMTWGDKFLVPNKPLRSRHREVARMAAHGKTNNEIARRLGYSAPRVCVLLSNTRIKAEIEKYRDRLFEVDTQHRLNELACDALDTMEEILISPNITPLDKESAAKWVLEKVSGKASQQINIKGDITLGTVLDRIDQMVNVTPHTQPAGEGSPRAIEGDSSEAPPPAPLEPVDEFDTWLDKYLGS